LIVIKPNAVKKYTKALYDFFWGIICWIQALDNIRICKVPLTFYARGIAILRKVEAL
jgi:hypothetical protein